MTASVLCPFPECRQPLPAAEPSPDRDATCPHCGRLIPAALLHEARSAFRTAALSPDTPLPRDHAPGSTRTSPTPDDASSAPDAADLGAIGRFRLLERIGSGAFGVVYRAFDEALQREVALKVARADAHDTPDMVQRFLREPRAAANLRHPHIVPVHDAGRDGDRYWIASAFIRGRTLQEEMETAKEQNGFDPRRTAVLVRQLAEALAYAHREGIVHRDVKPSNVMLDEKDQPLLMDFGLAARRDAEQKLTREGTVLGTAEYMAPEQWRSQAEARSDQYSLGVVLFELLTGKLPFSGGLELMVLHQRQEPPSPRQLQPRVPRDLEAICLKGLEKEPNRRYRDCGELAEDLRRWLAGEPTRARPVGQLERAVKWVRRRPAIAGLLAVVALLTVSGTGLVTWQWRSAVAALQRADREQRQRALAQVNALCDAAPGAVPSILADLERDREVVLPRLRELWAAGGDEAKRMRLALALLPVEPELVREELVGWLLKAADPAEVLLACDALLVPQAELRDHFWGKAEDANTSGAERLRALVALAAFDPGSERWARVREHASGQLLAVNPFYLGQWAKALRPVRGSLVGPLSEVFRNPKLPELKTVAATVLADYAADNPNLLAELMLDAEPKQYAILRPVLETHRVKAVERMRRQLAVTGHEWQDAPLNAAWTEPAVELKQEIEKADGLIAERFALCQSLPLDRLQAVTAGLRSGGYRPVRVRPWARGEAVRVAVVWTRDGRDWKLDVEHSAAEVKTLDEERQKAGFIPADAAAYRTGEQERYAVVWVKAEEGEAAHLYVAVPEAKHKTATEAFKNDGFIPATVQALAGAEGGARFSGTWWKGKQTPPQGNVTWDNDRESHEVRVKVGEPLLVDVDAIAPPQRYAAVWQGRTDREATEVHGLGLEEHLGRCRELLTQGWRPAGLSVTTGVGGGVLTASVWQRPVLPLAEREQLARQQAQAGVTLLHLGDAEPVWPLLRHSPDPEARSQLLWRLGLHKVDPRLLVQRLEEEQDDSVRRALIVGLGEFTGEELPPAVREPLTVKLLQWYRDDPDHGIHGAIDWLLGHAKEGVNARPLAWGQAAELDEIEGKLKRRDPDGLRRWYVNKHGQTMVLLPGPHEFRMGAPVDEPGKVETDERLHLRRIERNFAIASKAVTVAQWEDFLKARPDLKYNYAKGYSPEPGGPIISVTWYEAAQYCNWLSEEEGIPETEWCYPKDPKEIKDGMTPFSDYLKRKGYRLPTEAEWECACRAGAATSRYYGYSLELLPRYAWYIHNATDRTWPVGQKRPNDLGLFDVQGNIWSWVQDPGYYYPQGSLIVDKEDIRDIKDTLSRGLRGGSFGDRPPVVRSARRNTDRPDNHSVAVGVRPARTYD